MPTRIVILVVGLFACATNAFAGTSASSSSGSEDSQRADLYPQVSRFLVEATALEPPLLAPRLEFPTRGVLPGWRDRVCPQLTGLSGQEGDFILTRISDIARATGIRMDSEHCSPNLHIFVTDRPNELLDGLRKQNSYAMFGPRGRPYLLDQFTATSRPVRVWYNIYGRGPEVSFSYAFTRVLVIVDQTQLQGVSRGQLADYIAMVGLAEIKPDAHLEDSPTILRLFDRTAQAAPEGMSDWDMAFLRSLYSGRGPWKRALGRTDQLALSMVAQIAR